MCFNPCSKSAKQALFIPYNFKRTKLKTRRCVYVICLRSQISGPSARQVVSPPFSGELKQSPEKAQLLWTCYTAPLPKFRGRVCSSLKTIKETKVQPFSGPRKLSDPHSSPSTSLNAFHSPAKLTQLLHGIQNKATRIWKARSEPTPLPTRGTKEKEIKAGAWGKPKVLRGQARRRRGGESEECGSRARPVWGSRGGCGGRRGAIREKSHWETLTEDGAGEERGGRTELCACVGVKGEGPRGPESAPRWRWRSRRCAPSDARRTRPQTGPGPGPLVTCSSAAAGLPTAEAAALKRLWGPTSHETLWRSRNPSHGVSGAVPGATPKASSTDRGTRAAEPAGGLSVKPSEVSSHHARFGPRGV